jgi:alanine racemase
MKETRHRSWVEVSRSRIAANYRAVRDLVGPDVEVMPVVKADAYRHGAQEVSRVLVGEGARWLAVSSVEEGVDLRRKGIEARILVMAGFLPHEREALVEFRLTPVVHSLADLPSPVGYHLKIDSGMGRLGTRSDAAAIALAVRSAGGAAIEGLMSHFASASDYASLQSDEQTAYFNSICDALSREGLQPPWRHMASTIPVAYGRRESWGNLVRPGHAIYGYVSPVRPPKDGPAPRRLIDVAPALTWKASLLAIKEVPKGARIGYGAMFTAGRTMRIGVLAVGYADGIPHRLSNRGHAIAAGRLAPIIGAVSMDLTTVDLTEAPELQAGDAVTVLGQEGNVVLDAQQMAREAGTISYALLCGIHARVHRVYVD